MDLMILAPIGAVVSLLFAGFLALRVKKFSTGTEMMTKIAQAIKNGAKAYLKRQYKGVAIFFAAMFVILLLLSLLTTGSGVPLINGFAPFTFIIGGVCSGLAGFIGMSIATSANARTAHAASQSLNKGLRVAFSSGGVMGFVVVGLGLLPLTIFYYVLHLFTDLGVQEISSAMLTFGMGASAMALFARVGGGIFTKAADVGADLVGKVEAGIPEDDPRNPAVIADNVGDNVGDVAGMGADLYESYIGAIVSAGALAVAAGLGEGGMLLPMIIAALGIFASIFGTFFVRAGEKTEQKVLLAALRRGVYISSVLFAVVAFVLIYFVMGNVLGDAKLGVFLAIFTGLVAGNLIGFFTEYYTSDTYRPTRKVAEASATGPATVIIGGLSLGMKSTVLPVLIVGGSVLAAFFLAGGAASFEMGLFGIGLSAVGMLSTLGITLATDAYGPVADNAGGIAEMSHMDPEVRKRTDALDSLGNTTAATGKGFAIGSAALTALALIATFISQVGLLDPTYEFNLEIINPPTLIGLFIGAMLPFLFAALTMSAVGRAAQGIVLEVRRQFKEIKGLMTGKAEPDYARCVDICTRSAQKEMLLPSLIAIIAPVITGLVLGASAVAAMLAGATITGFILAIMMANSGGSWDNAKKYIEAGNLGGKGSDAHKATVVGDTVGDPFKDTSGPSLNILIKLLSMVAIVFAGLILSGALM